MFLPLHTMLYVKHHVQPLCLAIIINTFWRWNCWQCSS